MNLRTFVWTSVLNVAWATSALADDGAANKPPKTEYSVSLLTGFGAGDQFEDDTRNRYGVAIGARAGLTLAAPRLYFGMSFLHFGGYQEASQEVHANTFDGELGYEFRLLRERLLIRPELALGFAQTVTVQADNGGYPIAFHWAPGVLVGVRFSPLLLSAEYRRDMVPSDWPSSNSVLLGFGLML
jgi:hypothetical protein